MTRKFRYYVPPDVVKQYLSSLGLQITENYGRDGTEIGFTVSDSTVGLNYDIRREQRVVGFGMIYLQDSRLVPDPTNPHNSLVDADPEVYARSRKLYQKLYRRFSKPKPNTTGDTNDLT
jgi:hypothetical protein